MSLENERNTDDILSDIMAYDCKYCKRIHSDDLPFARAGVCVECAEERRLEE